jgi:hypothetical protein
MDHFEPVSLDMRIIEAMIDLTRLKKSQRILIAGSERLKVYLALQSQGFTRIATAARGCDPSRQHDVGVIAGEHSASTLETVIAHVVHRLTAGATLAVLIDSRDPGPVRIVQAALQRVGFRIEAAASCDQGRVLTARRNQYGSLSLAA